MRDAYWIDRRTKEDVVRELFERAEGYLPEWDASVTDPDIAGVLLLLYASQMEDNIRSYNRFIDRCHIELVNMLGIWQMSSHAARMMVVMKPVAGQNGGYVEKGTALVVNTQEEENPRIIFETVGKRFITDAVIDTIIMSDKVKLLNQFIYKKGQDWESIDLNKEISFSGQYNKVILYHKNMFNTADSVIRFEMESNIDFSSALLKGDYEIGYLAKEGVVQPAGVFQVEGNSFSIKIENPLGTQIIDEEEQRSVLYLTQKKNSDRNVYIRNLTMTAMGKEKECEYILTAGINRNKSEFRLFGDSLELYSEAYIGMDEYFRQSGAVISLLFEYSEEIVLLGDRPKEEADLRIIKRRNKYDNHQVIADVYAGKVLYEYYTEKGWKRLTLQEEEKAQELFCGKYEGVNRITFVSPEDWIPADIEGYSGRCIRIQLTAAEFAYYQPARHHLPVVKNLFAGYSYQTVPQTPESYRLVEQYDQKEFSWTREDKLIFPAHRVDEDALVLGFDKKIERGPVSLFFQLTENRFARPLSIRFEYFSKEGFKKLTVEDYTAGGVKSGMVEFVPPTDWTETSINDRKAYYIRIVDSNSDVRKKNGNLPVIERIYVNGVETVNIHRLDEVEFYIESSDALMEFNLGIQDLYDVEVWVNEKDRYSERQMRLLVAAFQYDYRIIYDNRGKVKSFLVKWHETTNFGQSEDKKVYLLDRSSGKLLFGDGVTVNIPEVTDDLSFTVIPRICNGSIGNVGSFSAESLLAHSAMISDLYNPLPSFGGSDIESVDRAAERVGHLLCSSGRLVTARDFEREVMAYSENIFDVKCLPDNSGKLDIVVLRKYQEGGVTGFWELKNDLLEHLVAKSEMTLKKEDICIREPIFVELSILIWGRMKGDLDKFAVEDVITELFSAALDPIKGNAGRGWKIGEYPSKGKLLTKLSNLQDEIEITNFVVNARYTDETGTHDAEALSFEDNPYIVIRNGVHKVTMI